MCVCEKPELLLIFVNEYILKARINLKEMFIVYMYVFIF